MASPKKRTRSLTREDDEDEEAHPKKEIDLNKEPELDEDYDLDREDDETDDDDAIQEEEEEADHDEFVASESEISEEEKNKTESEDEDANDERSFHRNRAPEDFKAREDASWAISHLTFLRNRYGARNQQNIASGTETKEDDSEITMSLLSRWETPLIPPENIFERRLIEQCSRPIRKQLTVSDVSDGEGQSRLALSKPQVDKKFAHLLLLLGESEVLRGKEGIRVSVYGPDGNVHEMKMCADEDSHYLAAGWSKFVGEYELREYCDFVTVWMIRHRDTHKICLAIDTKRLSLTKVSKRISQAAFEDSD
ncbi:unnamed protein product [Thlaspi arvense]|uniref:TF-B3 domain-containing protein n=1 Tax=Thlaspi arvense TaxID=13288 RepID=A0AAU9S595_THLAR|nr:unnamed protein product [Thlaspi arvense]